MDRRDFLERLAALGLAGAAALVEAERLFASAREATDSEAGMPEMKRLRSAREGSKQTISAALYPHLVAVRGGDAIKGVVRRFDEGMTAIGGIGRFVPRGSVVAIKPNIGWDVTPDRAANANPLLVARIAQAALEAGAKKVYVFDHSCDEWKACYRNSGIEKAARDAGATMAPANAQAYYQTVEIKGGKALSEAKVHELALESDVLINVPVLKSHGGAGMTAALKNLMGLVWDRGAFHARGLDSAIAEIGLAVRPDLTVLDAGQVMLTGGPRGNASSRYAALGMLMISTDMVAVDAAAAKAYGRDAAAFPYIGKAATLGLGSPDLERMDIRRISF